MKHTLLIVASVGIAAATQAYAADSGPKLTLNADEAPDSQPWSEPASLSYTKDKGSKAAIGADVAARIDWGLSPATTNTGFARLVAHRNTAKGEQTENYSAEIGFHLEPPGYPDAEAAKHAYYLYQDVSLAYAYKTNFDDEADGCDLIPTPTKCIRSKENSVRLQWTLQPFHSSWEAVPSYVDGRPTPGSPPVAYSFGPLLTFFADDITDAKLKAGVKPKGVVSGAKASFNLALSPAAFEYRMVFRASVQQIEAFQRSPSRRQSFDKSNTFGKLSVDYDLGLRSFEDGPGWAPSIGASYTKGDDPLSGKADKNTTFVGFMLTHKSK